MNIILSTKTIAGFLLTFLFPSLLIAQDTLNFPLGSQGAIPDIFVSTSTAKYQLQLEDAKVSNSVMPLETQEQFYLETNFGLDQLLRSGLVTYGDDISAYLESIADIILADDPYLRSQLRFFTIYSPFPNAFATQRGTIYVNSGLLARLKTEAQIAFILCHEIAHFQENHSLTRYVEYADNLWKNQSYRRATNQEKLLIRNNFSQQQELDADSIGYALFQQSPYGTESVAEVFDVLDKAEEVAGFTYLSKGWLTSRAFNQGEIDSLLFKSMRDTTSAETPATYVTPSGDQEIRKVKVVNYNLDVDVDEGTGDSMEEEDEESHRGTHPNPQKRKALFLAWVEEFGTESSKTAFVQSPGRFLHVRKLARLETISGFLYKSLPMDAIMTIRWLESEGGDTQYLEKLKILALSQLAMVRLEKSLAKPIQEIPSKYKKRMTWAKELRQGNVRLLLAVATSYLYDAYEADTVSNAWVRPYLKNLVREVESYVHNSNRESAYLQEVLDAYSELPLFSRMHKEAADYNRDQEDWEEFIESEEGKNKIEKWTKEYQRKGYRLGVDSLLVFSPEFISIKSSRNRQKMYWIESEKLQISLSEDLESLKSVDGSYTEILDPQNFDPATSPTTYNESIQIQRWIDQILDQGDKDFVPYNQGEVEAILLNRGIKHIAITGAYAIKNPNYNGVWLLLVGSSLAALTPPLWPVVGYQIFKKKEKGMIFMVLLDVEESRIKFTTVETPTFKVNNGTASHYIEFMIEQVHQPRSND